MVKDKDREFYKNLDEYKRSRNGCSCFGFVLLMIGILVVAEVFLFYVARSIKYDASQDATFATAGTEDLKFSNLEEGKNIEVIVSEGILCSKISAARDQKKLACIIDERGVTLTGKIATFLPSNAAIVVFPEVKSGRISYRVDSLKVGQFGVPRFLAPTVSSVFEKTISPELEGVEVERIELDRGIMVIIGERK
jgi:hypothetical protein